METFWFWSSYVTLAFSALVTTALVIMYLFTRWEITQVGRQFMLTKMCLALVLDYWFVSITFIRRQPDYTPAMPPRAIICFIVGVVMLRWLLILVKLQFNERRHHEDLRS